VKKIVHRIGILALALAAGLPSILEAQQVPAGAALELDPYVVGEARPPVDPGAPFIEMTLQEAIDRALENNLDIQSARLNPLIQDYALDVARAAFTPSISISSGYNNRTNQSTSQLDGGQRTVSESLTFNTTFTQPIRWYGGRISTSFNNSRSETNNSFSTRNPSYNSSIGFSYTQPLLSGRRTDSQRTALETQQIQRDVVDIELESQVRNLTDQVRVAYWNLKAQVEQIEIQRRSLAQAEQLLENNRIRVELGTLAEIEVFQAEAQVANALQSLLNAEITWRNQELAFKRLLVAGTQDPLLAQTIVPTELPSFEAREVDIAFAIERALRERTDIQQQRQQRAISQLNLAVTRESRLPDLNLSAGYSLQGVGGNLFARSGLGGEPELVEESGYSDVFQSFADFDAPSWNVGLNFSYPLGTNAGSANYERAQLQLRQSDIALQSQELAITTEVTNAGLAVGNTFLQLEAARRSREAAERSLEAELTRFNVGVSTNFQVVTTQNSLTSARQAELRAIVNYVNAVEEFERVQLVGR
jgi:outer membrane protein TolC